MQPRAARWYRQGDPQEKDQEDQLSAGLSLGPGSLVPGRRTTSTRCLIKKKRRQKIKLKSNLTQSCRTWAKVLGIETPKQVDIPPGAPKQRQKVLERIVGRRVSFDPLPSPLPADSIKQ